MTSRNSTSGIADDGVEPQMPAMVTGGDGTQIAVYEYGAPDGIELLLVHGFSQSHLAWSRQYESRRCRASVSW